MSDGEIKISELVDRAISLLPNANVLDCSMLTNLAKIVIGNLPSNDCSYEGEALCKLLIAAGRINKSKAAVDVASKKREKVGDLEVEYATQNTRQVWDDFLNSLRDLCPVFGYNIPIAMGIIINPSEKFIINDCPDVTELQL